MLCLSFALRCCLISNNDDLLLQLYTMIDGEEYSDSGGCTLKTYVMTILHSQRLVMSFFFFTLYLIIFIATITITILKPTHSYYHHCILLYTTKISKSIKVVNYTDLIEKHFHRTEEGVFDFFIS
jgi:hypothetical protein